MLTVLAEAERYAVRGYTHIVISPPARTTGRGPLGALPPPRGNLTLGGQVPAVGIETAPGRSDHSW